MATETMHIGRKISRIRELKGMKQETLAAALGVTQQAVSKIEQSEELDEERLKVVADALNVSTDAIKSFSDEAVIYNIQHNSDTSSNNTIVNYQFNPIEKYVEMVERNRELYERLLKTEREKIELLEKLLGERK